MDIPVTDAKARLTELVRRAEAGEEIVLTRHGKPAARIVPATPRPDGGAQPGLPVRRSRPARAGARPSIRRCRGYSG